jgi:hypothetical protein
MAFHSPKPKKVLTAKDRMLMELEHVIENVRDGGYLLRLKWITPRGSEIDATWPRPKKKKPTQKSAEKLAEGQDD